MEVLLTRVRRSHLYITLLLSANEFQRFIKNQLIEQTKVAFNSDAFDPNDNEMKGLGDCYCLVSA